MKMKKNRLPIAVLLLVALLLSDPGMTVPGMAASTSEISAENNTPDTQTYPTLDGGTHGMYSPDKELTIVLFIEPACHWDKELMSAFNKLNLSAEQTDICCINCRNTDREKMEQFAKNYPNLTFCYCEGEDTSRADAARIRYCRMWTDDADNGNTPTMVFTDKNGVVQYVQGGIVNDPAEMDWIINLINILGYGHLLPQEAKGECIDGECNVTYGQTNARQMLARINDFRTGDDAWEWKWLQNGKLYHTNLKPLTYDYELEKVAMQRAAEIIACYEHTRPNGASPASAYSKEFFTSAKGENIAIIYSPNEDDCLEEAAFTIWLEEDANYDGQGHRRNMLNESFTSVGIGHVVYKGWHYWVQEFSDKVVDDTLKEANDSLTKVNISVLQSKIRNQSYVSAEESITMKVGERIPAPQFHRTITTDSTFRGNSFDAPPLELLQPFTGKWTFDFSPTSFVQIDDNGNLFATRALSSSAAASYEGITVTIPITVNAAPSITPEPSAEPEPSIRPEPSAKPGTSVSPEPSTKPGASVSPEPSTKPGASISPEPSAGPDSSTKPAASVQPPEPATNTPSPQVTQKPAITPPPAGTSKPTATRKPADTQKTTNTQKPFVTSNSATVGKTITDPGSKDVFVVTSVGKAGEMPTVAFKKTSNTKKKTIVVPSTVMAGGITYQVTSIAANACKENKKVTKVKIPDTVTKISASAFQGCRALKTVTISKGVVTIDRNAFRNCKKLKQVTIKSKVLRSVGKNAFKGISKKGNVKVPKTKRDVYKKLLIKAGLAKNVKLE